MKVSHSSIYKKRMKSRKITNKEQDRINRITQLLYEVDNFNDIKKNCILKSIFHFERLKHDLNHLFSFRLNNKTIRLIVKPNSIGNYDDLHLEKEISYENVSFDHYKDL